MSRKKQLCNWLIVMTLLVGVIALKRDAKIYAATERPPIQIGGNEEDGYEYSVRGGGKFTSSCQDWGVESIVMLETEEGMEILQVLRNGQQVENNNGVFLDEGTYELIIGNNEIYTSFHFTISNEASGDGAQDIVDSLSEKITDADSINIIREPEMELLYDKISGIYRYTLPDGEWIEANIPQGAYHRGEVSVRCSSNLSNLSSYLNNELYTGEGGNYKEPGDYMITFWDLEVFGDDGTAYRVDFCFHIYNDYRMNLSIIPAPMGMSVSKVIFNGTECAVKNKEFVHLFEDGDYSIEFTAENASYTMVYTRDSISPCVIFSRNFEDGAVLKKEVSFNKGPDVSAMVIYRDGAEVTALGGKVAVNGQYKIEVSDSAGNMRIYYFTLRAGNPFPVKNLVILLLSFLLAAVVLLLYARRHVKVV